MTYYLKILSCNCNIRNIYKYILIIKLTVQTISKRFGYIQDPPYMLRFYAKYRRTEVDLKNIKLSLIFVTLLSNIKTVVRQEMYILTSGTLCDIW